MKTAAKYIIILAVFAIANNVVWFAVTRPRTLTTSESQAPAEPSVNVVVTPVTQSTLPDVILLPASVDPLKSVTVPVEIAGQVEWLGVEEGAEVTEGQELAKIDTRTLAAERDRARANYDVALSEFHRSEKLRELKAASDEAYEQSKSQLAVEEANLESARLMFERGTIKAPASGVLNRRFVEKGEYVRPGDAIAKIIQVSSVKVAVDIPEKDIKYVSMGTLLGVLLDQEAGNPVPEKPEGKSLAEAVRKAVAERKVILGPVTYRSVVADEKTRTFRVEVTVPNSDGLLLPGMIVRVVVLRRMILDAVTVPLTAVVPRESRAVVYVEKDSRARERTVSLGVTDGRNIEITQGLAPGDMLIVEGQRQLREGSLVKVVPPGDASAGLASAPVETAPASDDTSAKASTESTLSAEATK